MRSERIRRAVITGATGVIGRALIARLLAERVEILLLLRRSPRAENLPRHPLICRVECPLEALSHFESEGGYDAFFHLGWAGTFGAARADHVLQARNVRYAKDAAALAVRLGCRVFVGVGSQAEYGRVPWGVRLDGALHPRPETAYGAAKLAACEATREVCAAAGVRHVWARVLSVYGPHDAPHTLVTSAIAAFSRGEGGAFTKGEQMWDYLYAADAARALSCMARWGRDGAVYPVGSGEARPLREYILSVRDAVDPKIIPRLGVIPYPAGQVTYLCADLTELRADTGFSPTVPFAKGIRQTVAWYRREEKEK